MKIKGVMRMCFLLPLLGASTGGTRVRTYRTYVLKSVVLSIGEVKKIRG
jgi:hypothetical protein